MAEFTFFVAVCFTLNYVIGSGFLTLPWAFNVAGLGLSSLVLTIVSAVSLLTCWKLLEVMSRANKLVETFGRARLEGSGDYAPASSDGKGTYTYGSLELKEKEMSANTATDSDKAGGHSMGTSESQNSLQLGERNFEVAELCGIFLGPWARTLYVVNISLYFYGAMWAYSTVFCNAWSGWLPIPGLDSAASYYVYLLLWAVLECTWCLFELDEQIIVQVALAAGRILMVALMIGTVLTCDITSEDSFDLPSDAPGHATSGGDVRLFVPEKLYVILPITFYANIMHHSVPTLVRPVVDKTQSGAIFVVAFLISFVSYMTLALVVSTYFGSFSNPSSNLDWMHYLGVHPTDAQLDGTSSPPIYAQAISLFIVIFPSLDVASAFPLNAVTLGNNFMASYYDSATLSLVEKDFKGRAAFRLAAALPPIVAAALVHDLGSITAYTGLTGVVISMIVPAALSYASERALKTKNLEPDTVFSIPDTSGSFNIWVALVGALSVGYILYCLVNMGVPSVLT